MLVIDPVYMVLMFQVPLTLASLKSIHGDKASTFESQETIEIWIITIKADLE